MLGEAGMKKLFSLKMLDVDDIRKVFPINMLGGAGTKKLNS